MLFKKGCTVYTLISVKKRTYTKGLHHRPNPFSNVLCKGITQKLSLPWEYHKTQRADGKEGRMEPASKVQEISKAMGYIMGQLMPLLFLRG